MDILPDSRLHQEAAPKGAVFDSVHGWLVPIFCASCNRAGGLVPQDSTHAFWLCRDCEKYGELPDGLVGIPDEVVFQAIREEIRDRFGRDLTPEEIQRVVDTTVSPLTTLLTKGLR